MTSGIIKASFKDGSVYLIAAEDIEISKRELETSLLCNKAEEMLQSKYKLYGLPVVDVLQECHSDWLAISLHHYVNEMECLNDSVERIVRKVVYEELGNFVETPFDDYMGLNPILINLYNSAQDIVESQQELIDKQERLLEQQAVTITPEEVCSKLEIARKEWKQLPWWKRLWPKT